MEYIDIAKVSASHSNLTVAIAGLAFAILLLAYPLFLERSVDVTIDSQILSAGLVFFFFSLALGILASFQYSVMSGDLRETEPLMITWMFPSLAFGSSVITLFVGFVHIAHSFSSRTILLETDAQNLMNNTTQIVCATVLLLITRTGLESVRYLPNRGNVIPEIGDATLIAIIIGVTFLVVFAIGNIDRVSSPLRNRNYYFKFLILVMLYCIAGYAITSVLSSDALKVPVWPLYASVIVAWLLVLWTVHLLRGLRTLDE